VLQPNAANLNNLANNASANSSYGSLYNLLAQHSDSMSQEEILPSTKSSAYESSYSYYGGYSSYLSSDYINGLDAVSQVRGRGYTFKSITALAKGNPYADDYNYANDAYFGEKTASELADILQEIIEEVQTVDVNGFLLESGSNLVIDDELGSGMAVYGSPVLRYDGTNYAATSYTNPKNDNDGLGSYVEYTYSAKVTRQESNLTTKEEMQIEGKSLQELDLSKIKVRVYYGTAGQTNARVKVIVPEDLVPVYYPELYESFYYEELPLRVIYRVGLSESEINNIQSNSKAYEDATYYVSAYDQTTGAAKTTVTFTPAVAGDTTGALYNTYYYSKAGSPTMTAAKSTVAKAANTTSTASYVITEAATTTGVTQTLGNNGVLKLTRVPYITLQKVWPNGAPSSDASVTVDVYRATSAAGSGGVALLSLSAADVGSVEFYKTVTVSRGSGSWVATFDAPGESDDGTQVYTYYIKENVPSGYTDSYANIAADGGVGAAIDPSVVQYNLLETELYEVPSSGSAAVLNYQCYELPSSGGVGAGAPVAAGCALAALSLAALATLRRTRRTGTPISPR
jgi:hypothetical protein